MIAATVVTLTMSTAGASGATHCSGNGNVVAIHTTCAKARAAAHAYLHTCAHEPDCSVAGFAGCHHLSARRIECVGGTSSDPARPIARFTTPHRVP